MATYITSGVCALVAFAIATAGVAPVRDDSDLVNVVSVARYEGDSCPAATCSGLMVTNTLVLTAASCTVVEERRGATKPDAKTESRRPKTKLFVGTNDPDITVFLNKVQYRKVIFVYRHPEWDPKTHVGDLAILKIESAFRQFGEIEFPQLIGDIDTPVPKTLSFRGFGSPNSEVVFEESNLYFSGKGGIPDINAKRILEIEFSPHSCKLIENNGPSSEMNPNWWSFFCTLPEYARTEVVNTLCIGDVGGPLYVINKDRMVLWGVHSYMIHARHPFCGEECGVYRSLQFPCDAGDSGTYYWHTALIDRYTWWLRLVVESALSERTTPSTVTTPDPLYGVDIYADQREMVENYHSCPTVEPTSDFFVLAFAFVLIGFASVALMYYSVFVFRR